MNNNIIFSPTENESYVILRNTKINHNGASEIIFQIKFAPVDLIEGHDYNIIPYRIPKALENVYRSEMAGFAGHLKYITELQAIPELSTILPDYHEISVTDNMCSAEFTYYEGEPLNAAMPMNVFFCNLYALCKANTAIVEHCGREAGAPHECIIFEPEIPGAIHFMHLDFDTRSARKLRECIANRISRKLFGRSLTFSDKVHNFSYLESNIAVHPNCIRAGKELLRTLLPVKHFVNDWKKAQEICLELCSQLESNDDFFLHRIVLHSGGNNLLSDKIGNSFNDCNHVVFVKDKSAALNYVYDCKDRYTHIAAGNAENGLKEMLAGPEFALSSDNSSNNDKLQRLNSLCTQSVLLIIENCNVDDDALFPEFLKLPADIIFISEEDYSDYGFVCIEDDAENG